ncbi:hypothetical protein LTV02_27005 [Nocardia yamanashiensis]|uniref:hypothetical protein n=1 Tax=Nocardia yamanashiensis TaxID=209247 RepID=UPI001E454224|nr:hypothetical protein [Nocardia yamanashiensis]UGT39691.1 hypothetical protein LTV02_27005 [Nocardia yamanashiensis]
MTTPSDPTLSEVLRGTALGPMLDRPVNSILRDMGLPTLPEIPAVSVSLELPPLPTLDLSVLTRPLTDLASSFGTGQLNTSDATTALSNVSSALQTVLSLVSSLASMASSDWSGDGATSAAVKGTEAAANTAELETQNVQQKTVLTGAAGTVAVGNASMAAIITKFVTGLTIAAPFLVTPAGQVFVLSLASETAAEATAVVASTKAQLGVHSANMTAAGQKVAVTKAPSSSAGSMSQLTQLLSLLSTGASTVSSGVQSAQQSLQSIAKTEAVEPVASEAASVGTGGSAGGAALSGAIGALAGAGGSAPLSQLHNTRSAATAAPAAPASESGAAPVRGNTAMAPGMVPPMSAAHGAGLAARGGDAGDDEVHSNLVTGEHGDEVVGELGNTGVPVVGAVGTTTPRVAP